MLSCKSKECTGCGMCYNVCPNKAIDMVKNKEGLLEPKVNQKKCVNCNLCNRVCPVLNKTETNGDAKCYAVQLKDKNLLIQCASGGAFAGIAVEILNKGGIVCGVSDKVGTLKYTIIDDIKNLYKILSSKYYQCNISKETIKKIEEESKNRIVLVSGTPCQISALKNNIKINKKNLYTFEIICQGVPSEFVIQKYYKEIEKKYNKKIVNHFFRSKDKKVGRNYLNKYVFADKEIKYYIGEEDPLSLTFQRQLFLRNSCYSCKYTNNKRVADFTAGDLWIKEYSNKNINLDDGVSVLLCNTVKAIELFDKQSVFEFDEKTIIETLKENLPFNRSVKKPLGRFIGYKLLNIGIKPSLVSIVLCPKYYIKGVIKKVLKK